MTDKRWTCRHVDPESIELLKEVKETSGTCLGELLSDAINQWYELLPFENEDDVVVTIADQGHEPYVTAVLVDR